MDINLNLFHCVKKMTDLRTCSGTLRRIRFRSSNRYQKNFTYILIDCTKNIPKTSFLSSLSETTVLLAIMMGLYKNSSKDLKMLMLFFC